jgi:hypothetical protein
MDAKKSLDIRIKRVRTKVGAHVRTGAMGSITAGSITGKSGRQGNHESCPDSDGYGSGWGGTDRC